MKAKRIHQYIYIYNICDTEGVVLSKKDVYNTYLKTVKTEKDEKIRFENDERVVIERITTRIVRKIGKQGDLFEV